MGELDVSGHRGEHDEQTSVQSRIPLMPNIGPSYQFGNWLCRASLTGMLQVTGHPRLSVSDRQAAVLTFLSGTQRAQLPSPYHLGACNHLGP